MLAFACKPARYQVFAVEAGRWSPTHDLIYQQVSASTGHSQQTAFPRPNPTKRPGTRQVNTGRQGRDLFPTCERFKTERYRLLAVSVHNPDVTSKLRRHYNGSRPLEEPGIVVERGNHSPDELGAFAIRQIQ